MTVVTGFSVAPPQWRHVLASPRATPAAFAQQSWARLRGSFVFGAHQMGFTFVADCQLRQFLLPTARYLTAVETLDQLNCLIVDVGLSPTQISLHRRTTGCQNYLPKSRGQDFEVQGVPREWGCAPRPRINAGIRNPDPKLHSRAKPDPLPKTHRFW